MCIQEMFKTLMQEYKKTECVIDKSQIVFDMEKKSQMSYQSRMINFENPNSTCLRKKIPTNKYHKIALTTPSETINIKQMTDQRLK